MIAEAVARRWIELFNDRMPQTHSEVISGRSPTRLMHERAASGRAAAVSTTSYWSHDS